MCPLHLPLIYCIKDIHGCGFGFVAAPLRYQALHPFIERTFVREVKAEDNQLYPSTPGLLRGKRERISDLASKETTFIPRSPFELAVRGPAVVSLMGKQTLMAPPALPPRQMLRTISHEQTPPPVDPVNHVDSVLVSSINLTRGSSPCILGHGLHHPSVHHSL